MSRDNGRARARIWWALNQRWTYPSPKPGEPTLLQVRRWFWRLNMDIHPANRQIGWVMGRGRWKDQDSNAKWYTGGGVDTLLTDPKKKFVDAILDFYIISSLIVLWFLQTTKRAWWNHLNPTETAVFAKLRTAIAFGLLEYDLAFTEIDQSVYKEQLQAFAPHKVHGLNSAELLDPTPAETNITIRKYIIRSLFRQVPPVGCVQAYINILVQASQWRRSLLTLP